MPVPNKPFWVSAADAEFNSNNWATDILRLASIPAPRWVGDLGGLSSIKAPKLINTSYDWENWDGASYLHVMFFAEGHFRFIWDGGDGFNIAYTDKSFPATPGMFRLENLRTSGGSAIPNQSGDTPLPHVMQLGTADRVNLTAAYKKYTTVLVDIVEVGNVANKCVFTIYASF